MRARRSIAAILFSLFPLMAAPSMTFPEADEQLHQGRYVDVLEFALETLRHDPDSFPALYLLGAALHHGEGNLPLAQRRLEQAKRIVERRGGYSALSDDEKKMYVETLEALFEVCGQSEQYKEQLQIVDLVKLELGQDWSYRSGWALMKLGRIDEARSLMRSYVQNSDPDIRSTVMNTLGAIESAAGNLEVSYDWFTKIMNDEEAKKTFGGATLYANRSETAVSLLWFGRAESDLLEAVKHFSRGTYSNPWSDLTMLYTGEGKLPLAIDAARQMRDWDRSSDAEMEQLRWNLNTRMRAILLLAVGHDRAALDTLEMVLRRPDRQGTTSSDPVEAEICLLAVYDEALRVNRERAWENLTWRRPSAWFGVLREVASLSMEDWSTRSRLRALVMKNDKLAWVLRPYTQDTVIPEWVRPSIVAALGEGMAVNRLRGLLQTAPERERSYLRETLGESEVRNGHFRSGIEVLEAALHELPQEEPLLRARAHAMLAEAQERSGRTDEARMNYLKAFELDACVFRSLSISIPVSIRTDGEKASRLAASWLESSRRFRPGNALIIDVSRTSDGLEAILEDPSGAVLGRAGIRSSKNEDEAARLLRDDAQQKFFAPRMNFEQADLKSLDGSPVSGGGQ